MTVKTFLMQIRNLRTHYRIVFPTTKHFEFDEYAEHSKTHHSDSRKLIKQFINKGYKKDVIIQQIWKVHLLDQKQLLHEQNRHDKECKALLVTYSQALPNLKNILTEHWHILQAN